MENSATNPLQPLRVLPLGGLGEIGMNCMVLEYADEIILVDCGFMFSDLDHFGVELVVPDFKYLKERKDKIKAVFITHGHEDHIGALPFLFIAGIDCPVYASAFSSMLIREKLSEYGLSSTVDLRAFRMGDSVQLKHFKITTTSVNHSIVDAAALLIDTPLGKVIHTGDFKIDATPFYGQALDQNVFAKAGDEGVLLLLSDSTNVEKHDHNPSEQLVYSSFEELLASAQGMTVISMFASNVARMGQVFEIAKKMGKKVALSGRSMEQNAKLAMDVGYLKDAQEVLIALDEMEWVERKDLIILSTGSQGEYRSSLIRAAHGEHKQIKFQAGDQVLMSSKFIPGNEKAIGQMINNLFKQGAQVVYDAVKDIHVSGHATKPELKKMLELTRPKFFIPVHGEYRHLVHHVSLAKETGVDPENVVLAVNGDIVEITADTCEIVDRLEETKIMVENRAGKEITKMVLKDRRQLAEKGVVFALMARSQESRKIISGPEIIVRGLASEETECLLIDEGKKIVRRLADNYMRDIEDGFYEEDFEETVRIELRRYLNEKIGKKPVVIPIVMDV